MEIIEVDEPVVIEEIIERPVIHYRDVKVPKYIEKVISRPIVKVRFKRNVSCMFLGPVVSQSSWQLS